ncbi:MAG TPA: tetratricopeptide repeat protein [Actinophytocola sp.]|uniref:serine/threonine-protein kinase n=1 Tax=Actinophytocola sp. TaxID=1872138 RepID=UPI002DBADB45|nr:tetratricopeptide repeat protein [Actinophytocola sp.]HEU5475968.1 tetratricopeptide repeat protein [Actinophytocola sp.]
MTTCSRPACSGNLDEDGFCDTCGLAAPIAVTVAAAAEPATTGSGRASAPTVSTSTAWSTAPTAPATGVSRRTSSRSSTRGLLGAGLVEVPRVPYRDPRDAVLADPQVPEDKRYCSKCGVKVGRGRDGRPGRTEGFCAKCGHRYSFTPKLSGGDLVHGQYEVLGCLAHGGLGWIYLALDRAVADRWVVLKGLLDTGDTDAMAAAVAERQFLAEVEHPNIVKIHNFVQHRDESSDTATGYIVMEYVGGRSLKEMIKERRREIGPQECLPLAQAIAYALEVLPALGYLHSVGLLYCDFKPDNVIQTEEQLKLIDLGAVRRADDEVSAVYGTVGYQAPEIAERGPSVESDIYTVGRALAVMTFPFDFHAGHRERLPGPAEVPLLAEFDSFHRLLLRATATEPARRFGSAEEMREQLTGVLREVLAAGDGQPRPGPSTEFTPEQHSFGVSATVARAAPDPAAIIEALPLPRVDGADPAAAFLATVGAGDPKRALRELSDAPQSTVEVRLRLARTCLELDDLVAAGRELDLIGAEADARVAWHRGLIALAGGKIEAARAAFDAVYAAVPGELAPKLALAACAELAGDRAAADRHYRTVWRTDRSYLSAAFGLARVLYAGGDRAEAVDVLRSVPETSNHYLTAQLAAIRAQTAADTVAAMSEQDLVGAGVRLTGLELDAERRTQASRELLEAALAWVHTGRTGTGKVLDCDLTDTELRFGLERCYRTLARQAPTTTERIAFVDRANEIRPRTWV